MSRVLTKGEVYSRASDRAVVSVARCPTYEKVELETAIRECLGGLGGIQAYVSKGDRILLKPNMLSAREPEQAITTHPEVVRIAIRLVREAGGTPVVGDTPSGMTTESILRNLAEKTGIWKICEEEGVEFVFLIDAEKTPHPSGSVAKSFELASVLKNVDGVISLAKFKTHSFTGLTGAVKNLFGLIPGLRKAEYHFRMQSAEAFSELLVDLAECVKPRLTVMDGIVGMEGEGPSAGKARPLGIILASANVHALDAFMAEIVGAAPESVPTVQIARRRGLIPSAPGQIEIVGGNRESFRIHNFKMPGKTRPYGRIPTALGWWFGESVARKPIFSRTKCTMCEMCIDICPAKALKKNTRRPRIDRSLCFRCYCCQETCAYSAIKLRRIPGRSLLGLVHR